MTLEATFVAALWLGLATLRRSPPDGGRRIGWCVAVVAVATIVAAWPGRWR